MSVRQTAGPSTNSGLVVALGDPISAQWDVAVDRLRTFVEE